MNVNKTRLYVVWKNMKARCYNRNRPDYKYYGAKGITVCDEWQTYGNFEIWAKQNGYDDNLTIDRIDVLRGYEPSNCRWIPFSEQRENTTQARRVTINGKTQTLKAWCIEYGISYNMVIMRVHRGVDIVSALLMPSRKGSK
ncbi:hypothetical protein KQI82_12475 [Oscillibacter sp. MSJ-2]|uniref:Uncharacterized protein n=1 Tax=Dysosmobacter acutus TaxID=2841504 RepID=A0ABS6F8B9_9FIRM|nr:hypothetical protein [Dysosmobacter acutus]MBU5626521.1 hypothetical protein [Dysosmobacter acutus]MBU5627725.1 hypothetical protein [Dysosmobacter acutus]